MTLDVRNFRSLPVEIEAAQYTGENQVELAAWLKAHGAKTGWNSEGDFWIHTPEGTMVASPNAWVIRGTQGEFYPCMPEVFDIKYEEVDELVVE